jgi:hypothetical protein
MISGEIELRQEDAAVEKGGSAHGDAARDDARHDDVVEAVYGHALSAIVAASSEAVFPGGRSGR